MDGLRLSEDLDDYSGIIQSLISIYIKSFAYIYNDFNKD